jgi:hypothetical protein
MNDTTQAHRRLLRARWCGLFFAGVLAAASAPAADAPDLYLSLRGVADDTVAQGEPLQVSVLIEAPDDSTDTWLLAPTAGTWADAIAVEILGADGNAPVARGLAAGAPEQPTATVDAGHVAGGLWRVPAEQMQPLAPGAYRVRAKLVIADGAGWKGTARSEELPLTIVAASSAPERAGLKALALARDALLAGELEQAAKQLDDVLQREPTHFRALLLRARVADQAGNPLAAQWLLNTAQLSTAESAGGYPNVELEELGARVLASLPNPPPDKATAEPPAWSWPPGSVLRVLRERLDAANAAPGKPDALIVVENTSRVDSAAATGTATAAASNVEPVPASTAPTAPAPVTTATPSPGDAATGKPGSGPRHWVGDQSVLPDPNGQWAVSAWAGSQYGAVERSASRATGAPDVPGVDDHPNAWCPAVRDSGSDWLEVGFARAVPATEVRVRQSYGPGAIVKVEAIEANGRRHVWWEDIDPYGQAGTATDAVWFSVRVPTTTYAVQKIRLTLDLGAHSRWKQIDAVQLIGAPPR